MEEDMSSGEETWEEESWMIEAREEQRRLEILIMLLAAAAILAILVIYGDAFGIYDKISSTYGDIWEIIFPR